MIDSSITWPKYGHMIYKTYRYTTLMKKVMRLQSRHNGWQAGEQTDG